MNIRCILGTLLIAAMTFISYSLGNPHAITEPPLKAAPDDQERLYKTGSYLREVCFFDLYRVTFYTIPPASIVELYLGQEGAPAQGQAVVLDSFSEFLLDPRNSIPVTLSIEILRGGVSCGRQKKAIRTILGRAGYPVDEHWNLVDRKEHQEELTLFVQTIMGSESSKYGQVCRDIKKKDQFVLTINARDEATVAYEPFARGSNGRSETVPLPSSAILRGVFSTYLSRKACNPQLKDTLPNALLHKIVSAYKEKTYEALPLKNTH